MVNMDLNEIEVEAVRRVRQSPAERQAEMQVRADAMRAKVLAKMTPEKRAEFEAEELKLANMTDEEQRIYRMLKTQERITTELLKPASQVIVQNLTKDNVK